MRLLLAATIASTLVLGSCGSSPPTAEQVAAAIKSVCGITVTVADIATLITAGTNPVVSTVDGWAHLVCDQFKAQTANSSKTTADSTGGTGGVVVVNGVPIHYTVP